MAAVDEFSSLATAFSGLGVEEKALLSTLGKWHPEERKSFRRSASKFFSEDERQFEKWNKDLISILSHEFLRFKCAIVLWTMHPWERDARLFKEAITKGPEAYGLIIEVACTRSSDELLGARKAYHSLFDRSIEEDVAFKINSRERKLLVALVSSYRYEGQVVHEHTAKSEAEALRGAIQSADEMPTSENYDVVRVLSTRSKLHLKAVFKYYNELTGKSIIEDLGDKDGILKAAIECLCTPEIYFSEVLDVALSEGADEFAQEALTRIIISHADANLKDIRAEYKSRFGADLTEKIEQRARGNYRDFLLSLVARGE